MLRQQALSQGPQMHDLVSDTIAKMQMIDYSNA